MMNKASYLQVLKKAILAFFNRNMAKAWFCHIAQIAWPFGPAQFSGPSMARLGGCFSTASYLFAFSNLRKSLLPRATAVSSAFWA
ncbi:MAG: hypothetical protein PVG60_10860, partial [Desulfarculaceae bacterium]